LLHDLFIAPDPQGGTNTPPLTARPEAPSPPIPEAFRSYVGRYRAGFGPHQGAEFTVLVQAGALAVDIPGQMVFTLTDPDEEGWRSFTLTDLIAVSFQEGASGEVEAMRLAQTSVFPRLSSPVGSMEAVPDSLRPLLGDYQLPAAQGVLTVNWEEGVLAVTDPGGMLTPLAETDKPGVWETDERQPKRITFSTNPAGEVTAIALREIVILPRGGAEGPEGKRVETNFFHLFDIK